MVSKEYNHFINHLWCSLSLQGLMLVVCVVGMGYVDTSQVYHLVRGQSVIKLYVIYNMLDVREREKERKQFSCSFF